MRLTSFLLTKQSIKINKKAIEQIPFLRYNTFRDLNKALKTLERIDK